MKRSLKTLAAAAILLVAACNSSAPQAMTLNSKCPVSGKAVDSSIPTADYNGGKVGFCCPRCVTSWNAMSEADKQAKIAASK
jgi:hypothetical protein